MNNMDNNLHFVNNIFKPIDGEKAQVSLFPRGTDNEQGAKIIEIDQSQLVMSNHKGEIKEGWFVYYEENGQTLFRYGNLSPYARKQFRTFYELQEQLTQRYIDRQSEVALTPDWLTKQGVAATSYHINVGHGNCSIILLQTAGIYNVWMVDCSIIDCRNKKRHIKNLQTCLKDIAKELQLKEDEKLHIDRFFLTHTHYDHFNGMEYLIDNGHIDNNTLCYMNLYYHWADNTYLKILEKLKNANVMFVEPVSSNSNSIISFLHPECRLYRSKMTITSPFSPYRIANNPVNDSSIVISFCIGGHSMVFTGDLEQNGYMAMTKSAQCSLKLITLNYYVVSHHGSKNGHPCMPCQDSKQPKSSPLNCITHNIHKAILMGRDGAFKGIYSPAVINYWDSKPCVLNYTEHAPNYLKLDWCSGIVTLI